MLGERVQDKVGKEVKSILVSTHVKRGLNFTQILFGSGMETLTTITVNFKKRENGEKGENSSHATEMYN